MFRSVRQYKKLHRNQNIDSSILKTKNRMVDKLNWIFLLQKELNAKNCFSKIHLYFLNPIFVKIENLR